MNVISFSHVGFQHVGVRHAGFWHAAGHLSSEDGSRFATLKIDGWACDAFRACRAREATCGSWTWAVNIVALHTTAPHTANYKNLIWAGLETRLVYERAEPSVLAVLEQLIQLYMW